MIEVLKYLDPLWYFNLKSEKTPGFYFPDYTNLASHEKEMIEPDAHYQKLSLQDAAYQSFKKGIITTDPTVSLKSEIDTTIPLKDYYRFARKYFHSGWSLYFLMCRILTFNNPFKELYAFLSIIKVKRYFIYSRVSERLPEKQIFQEAPNVSLILPTLNRYKHLKNILNDLSKQTMPAFELIIVDQSFPRDEKFYESFQHLPLRIIYQEKKGQWLARNEAIKLSKGEFILFADDDSRVKEDWIEQHLHGMLSFQSDISAGVTIPEGIVPAKDKSYFRWAEEFDSGNAMVRRSVFKTTGLFDRVFDGLRMGDTEFGLRSYLAGFTSISNPLAARVHSNAKEGGMRYWGSREAFKPISFWGSRPDPGTLYLYHSYFEKKYLLSFLLVRILLSYIPYIWKKNILGMLTGFLLFIIFSPWWSLRLFCDWMRAQKFQPSIEKL